MSRQIILRVLRKIVIEEEKRGKKKDCQKIETPFQIKLSYMYRVFDTYKVEEIISDLNFELK